MTSLWPRFTLLTLGLALFAPWAGPAAAVLPPKPTAEEVPPFEVAQLSPASWYGRFGQSNCAWIDLGEGVLVIDTGGSDADAKNLIAKIKETTKGKPVKWIALTHLHGDSNNGLATFLPTDATIFVNARMATVVATNVKPKGGGKVPAVVGVSDRLALFGGAAGVVEIGVPPGSAHTNADLYVFNPGQREAFVGDLVNPDRCPMMSDPNTDPKGWIAALDRIESLAPLGIIPTRGNASKSVANDIQKTRAYIQRVLDILIAMRKQKAPESRVTGQLAVEKMGDYCPKQLDAINALGIYRRMEADGSVRSTAPPAK